MWDQFFVDFKFNYEHKMSKKYMLLTKTYI